LQNAPSAIAMESDRGADRRGARDSLRARPDRSASPPSNVAAGAAICHAYRVRRSNARSEPRRREEARARAACVATIRASNANIRGLRFRQPALPRFREHYHQRVQQPQDHPLHQPDQPLPRLLRRPQVAELLEGCGEAVGQVLCGGCAHRTEQEHTCRPGSRKKYVLPEKILHTSACPGAARIIPVIPAQALRDAHM